MDVKLLWTTPNGDNLLSYMARVSSPLNQHNYETAPKLISYLIRNKHWSPFEMVHACVEIETTRDMSRELLRHHSFRFQEFSQRYANPLGTTDFVSRETRMQDMDNRQSSLPCDNEGTDAWWKSAQFAVSEMIKSFYIKALDHNIAKEVARTILPEGMTPTKLYMVGSIRSWIHFWDARTHESVQKENQEIANLSKEIILEKFPIVKEALNG